jgi:hypothetical protein
LFYNEAVATIGKLTSDQLKIITLCFLLRYTISFQVSSWEKFKNYKSSISARQETSFANLDYRKVQLKIFETEKLVELFCKRSHLEP